LIVVVPALIAWRAVPRVAALATAVAAATASWAATLVRKPYVQNVRGDRAAILWTTLETGQGAVECSADPNTRIQATAVSREFKAAETGIGFVYYQHQADLSGLRPGVEYRCRVKADGQELFLPENAELTFRTAGPGPSAFLVFGDSGTGSQEQQRLARRMEEESASLAMHTGDIAYPDGSYAEQQAFYFDVYWRLMLRMPFFPSPGNHDFHTRAGEPYLAAHSLPTENVPAADHGRYYSFDWGNVHFVSLDTTISLGAAAAGMGEMLKWLESDLGRSRAFWRVVYFHHAPYASGPHETDPAGKMVREHIAPILDRHGVPLVFNGHEHSYQRTHPLRAGQPVQPGSGTVYVTTGGGGAALYPVFPRPAVAFGQPAHHFVRAEVDGSRMTVRALAADRREIDRFTLSPPPRLADEAAVNAASFTPALAPGGLVAIFGQHLASEEIASATTPFPVTLDGVSVELNGRPLPLLYVSGSQINTQLPFDVQGTATLRVITRNGAASALVTVDEVAPAIFSAPLDGGLIPVILHGNGTFVTAQAPAAAGERVSVHVTGLGQVNGFISEGRAAPGDPSLSVRVPIEVEIGADVRAPAVAGLLPGSVGVYRVEFAIPANVSGGSHPLRIRVGAAASNTAMLTIR